MDALLFRRRTHQALNKGAGVQRSDLTIYKGGAQANLSEARSLIPIQPGTGGGVVSTMETYHMN